MLRRLDPVALAAAVVALAMAWTYVGVVDGQGEEPALWVVVVLLAATAGAGYGAFRGSPARRAVLVLCGVLLGVLGLLAILSIGLPILVAAGLCLLGALRGPVRDRPAPG